MLCIGGGFSNIWSRPSYQDDAVNAYLSKTPNLPSSSVYNAAGRAIPDIAAFATNFQVKILFTYVLM
jgi:tripeptidyl-peptidase-1